MKLGTANIRNFPDMTHGQVAEDARAVVQHTTVAGLQEIEPGEDTPVVDSQLGADWDMVGGQRETPIIYDASLWQLEAHHQQAFHRPKLPRPQNPHGAVTSVVLRSRDRRHLPAFAVVNTHLVAGGYNGPKVLAIQDRWRTEWGMFADECVRLHRMGLTVFAIGDLNNPRPPKLRPHASFQWLGQLKGPDHLGQLVHESSVAIGTPVAQAVPLNSDHQLHVVTGPLRHADV